jgi:hypothetical protein
LQSAQKLQGRLRNTKIDVDTYVKLSKNKNKEIYIVKLLNIKNKEITKLVRKFLYIKERTLQKTSHISTDIMEVTM